VNEAAYWLLHVYITQLNTCSRLLVIDALLEPINSMWHIKRRQRSELCGKHTAEHATCTVSACAVSPHREQAIRHFRIVKTSAWHTPTSVLSSSLQGSAEPRVYIIRPAVASEGLLKDANVASVSRKLFLKVVCHNYSDGLPTVSMKNKSLQLKSLFILFWQQKESWI
jgi:hypothetical protein